MIIRDIMNAAVYSCSADQSLNDAARIMWDRDVGAVPVTDPRTGAVTGVVTDRDIAMAAYTRGQLLGDVKIADVMSREVHCAFPDHDVAEAHELMRRHQVRRLPVMNEARALVGFVSLNDLALASQNGNSTDMPDEVARTLAEVSRHRNGASSSKATRVTEQAAIEGVAESG
jgi:CBS domain-containing protein